MPWTPAIIHVVLLPIQPLCCLVYVSNVSAMQASYWYSVTRKDLSGIYILEIMEIRRPVIPIFETNKSPNLPVSLHKNITLNKKCKRLAWCRPNSLFRIWKLINCQIWKFRQLMLFSNCQIATNNNNNQSCQCIHLLQYHAIGGRKIIHEEHFRLDIPCYCTLSQVYHIAITIMSISRHACHLTTSVPRCQPLEIVISPVYPNCLANLWVVTSSCYASLLTLKLLHNRFIIRREACFVMKPSQGHSYN